jgi:hypothetical protein
MSGPYGSGGAEAVAGHPAPAARWATRGTPTSTAPSWIAAFVEPSALVGRRLKMITTYGSHTSVTVEGRKGI